MRTDFRSALAAAEDYHDSSGRISVIKRAVKEEVRSVDPTVSVRFTDYFNNSIAPDMVLQWPNESKERLLFVRPTASASWLLNELRFVSSHHPLVFTLEDFGAAEDDNRHESARQSLAEAASAANTWITDASGTEAMSGVRTQSLPLGLLGQAMVRGGRGISDGTEMSKLATDTEGGFAGASTLSSSAIRSAVVAIERHLDVEQSGRITRLLRAAWEGNGGDSAQFPITTTIGRLTEEDLSYILRITSEGSGKFWRGIGRAVNTELLARAQVEDPSPNFQALVSENLDILQAKGVRLIDEPLRFGESADPPRWIVARGCLALRGANWTAYVAARLIDEFPPADEASLPDLRILRQRASVSHVSITQVQFGRGDREFTYESRDGGAVLDDPGISAAIADLQVTDIDGAVAALSGGGTAKIDFAAKTASGPTSSTFPLGTLVRSTLPLLADFMPEEQAEIRHALADKDSLFPEWPLSAEN
jgi:hypothetical protein